MLTGYGRGWQEEKAVGRIARFRQRMREPTTTTTYIIIFGIGWYVLLMSVLLILIFHSNDPYHYTEVRR